ncbi:hypothetical protein BIT28_25125 [Photobacterium proteolyticum]|uniref:DUF2913 domain-containing protein n=1 Tax=Photobacterium proteolyticum TaxID=1903952 RepID=A0A1Q9GT70_9GAMM|nr:DUF2913 family protein [Photobacterium proteolyticum]OLQ78276.1 hypothetical protein BIT28_25125 [Photobacterium proteolyticum]
MSNFKYERLLSITIDNALLHLWITVASSGCYVPRGVRNQILVRWFKPKIKQAKYKLIKKELKSIFLAGKASGSLLEERLCELRELSQSYRGRLNDMHKLHYLLEHLREEHGIRADLSEGIVEYQPNTLYVSQKKLEQCFSDDKRQLKPILAMLSEINMDSFVQIVQSFGFHKVEGRNNTPHGVPFAYLHSID